MKTFEDLDAWKLSVELVLKVYEVSGTLPASEQYGLCSQINRAAVSIPANIAEGWGRGGGAAQLNHVRIARGSLYELKTLLIITQMIGHNTKFLAEALTQLESVAKCLNAYVRWLSKAPLPTK